MILGGAGRSGSYVARRPVERGEKVTVLVQPTPDRSRLAGLPVTYVVGDAMDPGVARAAMACKRFGVVFETLQLGPFIAASATAVADCAIRWRLNGPNVPRRLRDRLLGQPEPRRPEP